MSTALRLGPGLTIADLDNATPANRKLATNFTTPTALLYVANASDAVVFVTSTGAETVSGKMVPPGGSYPLGPYLRDADVFLFGSGAGSAHYTFDPVWSEQ